MNNGLTFRSSKIVYYGPHTCQQCGVSICKMAQGYGGNAFTYPDGPIYPNTEWHVHICNPKDILHKKAIYSRGRVQQEKTTALAVKEENLGWRIIADDAAISGNQTFYDSEDAAWVGAKQHVFTDEAESSPEHDVLKAALKPRVYPT